MGTVAPLLRMARPGNALMAAAGVLTGASLFLGLESDWRSVALAAASAAAGLAAGNILNDMHDVEVDRRAHPDRPLARGTVSFEAAAKACGLLFGLAIVLAFAANLLVGMFAGVLVVWLIAYETALKERGLVGNIWVSLVVAGTFAMGAAAAPLPPFSFQPLDVAVAIQHPRFVVPFVMSLLAFFANTAREVFKDVEDVAADAGHRRTLPVRLGARRAMLVGRAFLVASVLYAVAGFARHRDLGATVAVDAALLAPALLVFALASVRREPAQAQRWTKFGMVLALAGLFAMGLV